MQARHVATFLPTTLAVCCLFALALPQPAAAQSKPESAQRISYQIGAGSLDSVLNKFATQSQLQIVYSPELVAGKISEGLRGQFSPHQALGVLLKDKGIAWEAVSSSMYVLRSSSTQKDGAPKTPLKTSSNDRRGQGDLLGSSEVQELEKMIVVGSRLGTSPVESAMPIKVISREDIDKSGAGSIAQALSYLSEIPVNNLGDNEIGLGTGLGEGNSNSTTVQMRGLARGTTLILINGRRAGDSASFASSGQFDLSTIPLGLVERIEVLPAGASSVYGGDALAGVINVVLRRDASGLEVRFRKLSADGYGNDQISAMWGTAWDRASLSAAVNWSRSRTLYGQERGLTADQDYRRFGGEDLRSIFSNPGNVYSLAGCGAVPGYCEVPLEERAPLPGLSSSFAGVPIGQNGIGLTRADFTQTQGELNKESVTRHLRSAEQNYGVVLSGRLQIGEFVETFADISYSKRDVPAYQNTLHIYGGDSGTYGAVVSADNPFNPFGVPVGVNYQFRDTDLYTNYKQENYRGVWGLNGTVGRFHWEVSHAQTRDLSGSSGPAMPDLDAIQAALGSSNPATAFNPFVGNGAAPVTNEVMRSFYSELPQDNESRTDVLTGYIRGPILRAPAGDVLGLVGVERQRLGFISDSADLEGNLVPYKNGVTRSRAYFAELRVPVLAPRPGSNVERIALSAALRSESSDRIKERTESETIGIEFRPAETLLLRSTFSTAFRPLLNYYAIQNPYERVGFVRDPRNNPAIRVRVNTILFGGVPEGLKAETSTTTTLGLLYRPSDSLSISLTAWDIKFRDRITGLPLQTIVNNEETFVGRVRRNQTTGVIESVDARPVNISMDDTSGLDIGADVNWSTRAGEFHAGLTATYTSKYEQRISDTSPVTTHVAILNPAGWAPRWKIVPRVEWLANEWFSALIAGRYVSSYKDSLPLSSGSSAGEYKTLGDFWVADLNANVSLGRFAKKNSFLNNSKLSIGATNIFDRLPEFCAGCYGIAYDASQYDIIGRSLYAELRMNF